MNQEIKTNLLVKDKWLRIVFMVLFYFINWIVAKFIVGPISLFQFLYSLFMNKPHAPLLVFSNNLSCYIYQITKFLTYVSEEKPFPFSSWPTCSNTPDKPSASIDKPPV